MEIERQYILKLRKGTNHPAYEIYGAYCPKISLKLKAQQIFFKSIEWVEMWY